MFGSRKKLKNLDPLAIKRGDIGIKHYIKVTYLGCELDHTLSGDSMVTKVLGKINGRLKFHYRKQSFLNVYVRRMLCNALMQHHFDYAATAWYPNLNRKFSKKVQIAQNKCIDEFRKINWLPTIERFEQCVCLGVFKFCKNLSPVYMSDIFVRSNTQHNTKIHPHAKGFCEKY